LPTPTPTPPGALLPQFKRWYSQAGTPRLQGHRHYDAAARTYTLHFTQSCAPPGPTDKEPFVIPVACWACWRCQRQDCHCSWQDSTDA
jgi:hypothetical protein